MKKWFGIVAGLFLFLSIFGGVADARKSPGFHSVRSYTRKDGTHVRAHTRGSGPTLSSSRRSRGGYSGGYSGGSSSTYDGGSSVAGSYDQAGDSNPAPSSTYGAAPDYAAAPASYEAAPTQKPLDNTGGEPLTISLLGSALAIGALGLRHRLG